MKERYIPAIIMLVAGLVTSIVCLVKGIGIIRSLIIILVVLIIFYLVGRIAKFVITKTLQEQFVILEENEERVAEAEETQDSIEE